MVNDEILRIKDSILATVPDCEKIYLFGSYAYGTPHKDSDYDFYVVLNDTCPEMVVPVIQRIYHNLCGTRITHTAPPIDIHGNYKRRFEDRRTLPTLERSIADKGIVLYERA